MRWGGGGKKKRKKKKGKKRKGRREREGKERKRQRWRRDVVELCKECAIGNEDDDDNDELEVEQAVHSSRHYKTIQGVVHTSGPLKCSFLYSWKWRQAFMDPSHCLAISI